MNHRIHFLRFDHTLWSDHRDDSSTAGAVVEALLALPPEGGVATVVLVPRRREADSRREGHLTFSRDVDGWKVDGTMRQELRGLHDFVRYASPANTPWEEILAALPGASWRAIADALKVDFDRVAAVARLASVYEGVSPKALSRGWVRAPLHRTAASFEELSAMLAVACDATLQAQVVRVRAAAHALGRGDVGAFEDLA